MFVISGLHERRHFKCWITRHFLWMANIDSGKEHLFFVCIPILIAVSVAVNTFGCEINCITPHSIFWKSSVKTFLALVNHIGRSFWCSMEKQLSEISLRRIVVLMVSYVCIDHAIFPQKFVLDPLNLGDSSILKRFHEIFLDKFKFRRGRINFDYNWFFTF